MRARVYFALLALIIWGHYCSAAQYPRSMSGNPHIKFLTYNANAIHIYKGFYGYESSIVFEHDEEIETISMGDSKAWQFNPIGHRLFLKPIDAGATTNVTIMTNKGRVYHFEFHAGDAKGLDDEELAYEVRIVYPMIKSYETAGSSAEISGIGGDIIPDITKSTEGINFSYTVAGDDAIKPIRAFDDGRFTYIQFKKNSPIPAILAVDSDGYEELVNFRRVGEYTIIERVDSLFTLRKGSMVVCLFNETMPYNFSAPKRRSRGIFYKDY